MKSSLHIELYLTQLLHQYPFVFALRFVPEKDSLHPGNPASLPPGGITTAAPHNPDEIFQSSTGYAPEIKVSYQPQREQKCRDEPAQHAAHVYVRPREGHARNICFCIRLVSG